MNIGKHGRAKIAGLLALCLLLLAGCGRKAAQPGPDDVPEPIAGAAEEPVPSEAEAAGVDAISFDEAARRVRADGDAAYLFAVNVGKADALILRVGDAVCLVDAGRTRARGRILRGLELMGAERLDAVFVTHTDGDHTDGLEWLAGEVPVDAWYAPAMYTGVKAEKHPAARAAGACGQSVNWLRRGDAVNPGGNGAVLRVLAPASLHEDKDDNNSLVMMLESGRGKLLLAGDMELPEEAELLRQGDDLSCTVLKVPNHADDDTVSAAFAGACAAQVAVVSTSSAEKPETPDPGVVRRLEAAGSRVVVTQDSGLGVLVALKDGVVETVYVDFGAPPAAGVSLAEVDASDDRIILQNDADDAVNLGGFYLYSDRGGELFAFPEGARMEPRAALAVGTRSTDGGFDVLWDDKKVVNRKKADTIFLYDSWGRELDRRGNGR